MEATNVLYIASFNNIIEDEDYIKKGKGRNLFIIDTNTLRQSLEEVLSWTDKIVAALQLPEDSFSFIDILTAKRIRIASLSSSFTNIIIFSPLYNSIGVHAQLSPNIFYTFNGISILYTYNIEEVKEKEDIKKRFWQSIKNHYLG